MNKPLLEPTLPSRWYSDEAVFNIERQRIFCREWIAVCRDDELANRGDHLVLEVAGESVLLLRNREGELRAFYNVCRHRGARLCRPADAGAERWRVTLPGGVVSGRMIVCPYHQWSYDLNGALIAAPHLHAAAGFRRQDYHLYPVGAASWAGFVFLNLTPAQAEPLAAGLAAVAARIARYPLADLRIGATRHYGVAANWKILCENYNECYHCGGVHPELCEVVPSFREAGGANLDWSRGVAHRDGAYTFTRSGTSRRRAFPGLDDDERVRHKGELVYPNLFVSLACDHAAIFMLQARSAAWTDITCHFLFETHEIGKSDFDPSDAVDFWDLVNRQDWAICEAVQQGIRARVHAFGHYAPMEDSNLDIRRYVNQRIGRAMPSDEP
ncbi:MAG TPA: aromatic ring-hydroxylating dioxygenase subunit alpha [Steroidobacteraceae bacterium]|nr:aromatic ring-hydroxylating dioxygenase subunit alpha [Steroidobacteraceae bacterium]